MNENRNTGGNFSYPSSAAAVVFGMYLSAQLAYQLYDLTAEEIAIIENSVK